jgi:nitrite reductase/ring-hydroxylating ferredoxin subunit/uncharacterized membrane protein
MTVTVIDRIVGRIGFLEPLGEAVHQWVDKLVVAGGPQADAAKQFLNGVWLEHPLHPALTDIPIGAWSATAVLDLADGAAGGELGRGADVLLGIGCAGGVAAAISGLSDWQDKYGHERDLATAHGLLNSSALLLMSTSLALRVRGARRPAVGLSLMGLGLATAGAYLGGDLVYRLGMQVNRNAFTEGPSKWREVAAEEEVKEGEFIRKQVGSNRVLLTRMRGEICAASAICSHAGGPLDELALEDGQLHCPWHGSSFALRSGRVNHGPATVPIPVFETRVSDGKVEIRRPPR